MAGPQELSFYAGAPEPMDPKRGWAAYAFGSEGKSGSVETELLALSLVGIVVLLVPVFAFVSMSARVAGPERDRRLSAMRLVGADARQVRRIAAAESLSGAAGGLVLGAAVFLLFRANVENFRIFETSFYTGDVTPPWWLVALILLAVPGIAVGASLFALRRTIIEPLGVVRQSEPVRRQPWWRVAPFVLGPLLLLLARDARGAFGDLYLIVGAGLLLLGVPAVLPWLVERTVARFRGGPPSVQLALRRLQLDSATPARVVGGVAVVLAGVIALHTMVATQAGRIGDEVLPADGDTPGPALAVYPSRADVAAINSTRGIAGVRGVGAYTTVTVSLGPGRITSMVVGDCDSLRVLVVLDDCSDGDVFWNADAHTYTPQSGQSVSIVEAAPSRGEYVEVASVTLPANVPTVTLAGKYMFSLGGLLVTPGAVRGATLPEGSVTGVISLDLTQPDVMEHLRNTVAVADRHAVVTSLGAASATEDQQSYRTIRNGLLVGSLIMLLLASVGLLVMVLEQMRERRRPIAVLAATGVPASTLARSVLWQNALPMLLGVVVAVVTGVGLAALVFRKGWFEIDWWSVGTFAGVAVALVLLATALTLPTLRAAASHVGLRAE